MAWGIIMTVLSLVGMLVLAVASQTREESDAPAVVWEREYYPEQIDHQLWAEEMREPAALKAVEGAKEAETNEDSKPADVQLAA
jgi:hypothetical protein